MKIILSKRENLTWFHWLLRKSRLDFRKYRFVFKCESSSSFSLMSSSLTYGCNSRRVGKKRRLAISWI